VDLLRSSNNKEKAINNTIGECSTQHLNKGNKIWMLDTGATDHVACSMSLFISHYKIKPIKVKLPNDNQVCATHVGTVYLSKDIIIHNVLYIPEFTLNIISVQCLISALNCQLVFSHHICQIQEKNTFKMIGQAEIKDGLYRLIVFDCDNLVFSIHRNVCFEHVKDVNIWHCRLGHPSDKILECISKNYNGIHFDRNIFCTPCHLAKQHRLPFPLSKTIIDNVFYLIHIDIWGPFNTPSIYGHRYFLIVVDDFTRHTWVYLMRNKSETRGLLLSFVNLIKKSV